MINHITVGHRHYDIVLSDEDINDNPNVWGYYCPKNQTITIRSDLNAMQRYEVLIHEIAHVVIDALGLDHNEQHIIAMTSYVMLIVQLNKTLIEDIVKSIQ